MKRLLLVAALASACASPAAEFRNTRYVYEVELAIGSDEMQVTIGNNEEIAVVALGGGEVVFNLDDASDGFASYSAEGVGLGVGTESGRRFVDRLAVGALPVGREWYSATLYIEFDGETLSGVAALTMETEDDVVMVEFGGMRI